MASNELDFLQTWYRHHCNGDWEHQYGVELGTLDNPGWRLAIDLEGTEFEGRILERQIVDRSADDWLQAWSDGSKFHVAAGPTNLSEAIATFPALCGGLARAMTTVRSCSSPGGSPRSMATPSRRPRTTLSGTRPMASGRQPKLSIAVISCERSMGSSSRSAAFGRGQLIRRPRSTSPSEESTPTSSAWAKTMSSSTIRAVRLPRFTTSLNQRPSDASLLTRMGALNTASSTRGETRRGNVFASECTGPTPPRRPARMRSSGRRIECR